MTDPGEKKMNRRDFLYSFGAFSFLAVFGISPAIRVYSPASNMCTMNIDRKNNIEGRITIKPCQVLKSIVKSR